METLIAFEDLHPACQWEIIRQQRELKLIEADHLVETALDTGIDATPFRQYRQALRDITKTHDSAKDVVWPQKPSLPQASA
ncbi:phage tail assembly chaperone [Vibrio harveyi]|uniref:phage tail assembly chaperone n=1 Tax=Vibrio harveyi TaxID=669 RepID=UPI00040F9619|nr:phage tail assembly chaperone [Vibrio harveyi]